MPFDIDPAYIPVYTPEKKDAYTAYDLIAWLRVQNPEVEYVFKDVTDCLLCRFGRAMGHDVYTAGGQYFYEKHRQVNILCPEEALAIALAKTYGEALANLQKIVVGGGL